MDLTRVLALQYVAAAESKGLRSPCTACPLRIRGLRQGVCSSLSRDGPTLHHGPARSDVRRSAGVHRRVATEHTHVPTATGMEPPTSALEYFPVFPSQKCCSTEDCRCMSSYIYIHAQGLPASSPCYSRGSQSTLQTAMATRPTHGFPHCSA
jgi:hypothetical protein